MPSRFNTKGKTKGFFPITQFRFDTTKHPVMNVSEKCASAMETLLSFQETQMLEGLTNILQCNERDAIRIALYELALVDEKDVVDAIRYSDPETSFRGHTSRSEKVSIRLPKSERIIAASVADQLRISSKHLVRLAIIWLAKGIRSEEIRSLTKSRRIGQEKLAREWSKTYDGKGSKIKPLKSAAKKAYDKQTEVNQEYERLVYERRGEMMARARWESDNNEFFHRSMQSDTGFNLQVIDALIDIERTEEWETFVELIKDESPGDQLEWLEAQLAVQFPTMPEQDIKYLAQAEHQKMQQSKEDDLTDEELEEIFSQFPNFQ